jgi:6-pyruvoyltetrahydropterin/6-carboxytetrahydropterin synthase
MFRLTIKTGFAAAHNLINYQGDCENLHGHNWKIEVTITARELDHAGLAIDFKVLKRETNLLLDELDHKYVNQHEFFQNISPSSENIARYLYQQLSLRLNNSNVTLVRIGVWESDNACAEYYEE